MRLLIKIFVTTLAVLVGSYFLPGIHVDNFFTALTVAVVLGFLNAVLKPILIILTIPITIFTLGIFLLAINAFMILLTASLVHGFEVHSFWSALLFSFLLSIMNSIFERLLKEKERIRD